jgi:flagellar biosynthesis protein FlhG
MAAASQVWAFGGGKGGVGKSLVCSAVGTVLARRGRRVVALDADLGAANLHTLLGVLHPDRTLDDFFTGRFESLVDLCLPTDVDGLTLISGAAAILRSAHPRPAEKLRLARALLELDADHVLIDLGAGTHYNTLDFFNLAGEGVVVTDPEPTSVQNAYAFLKASLFRSLERALVGHAEGRALVQRAVRPRAAGEVETVGGLLAALTALDPEAGAVARRLREDFRAGLVVNQAGPREVKRVVGALGVVCRRYLEFELPVLGALPVDAGVARAVRQMRPVLAEDPSGPFARAIEELVERLLASGRPPRPETISAAPEHAETPPPSEARETAPAGAAREEPGGAPMQSRGAPSLDPPGSMAEALRRAGIGRRLPPVWSEDRPAGPSEAPGGAEVVAPADGTLAPPPGSEDSAVQVGSSSDGAFSPSTDVPPADADRDVDAALEMSEPLPIGLDSEAAPPPGEPDEVSLWPAGGSWSESASPPPPDPPVLQGSGQVEAEAHSVAVPEEAWPPAPEMWPAVDEPPAFEESEPRQLEEPGDGWANEAPPDPVVPEIELPTPEPEPPPHDPGLPSEWNEPTVGQETFAADAPRIDEVVWEGVSQEHAWVPRASSEALQGEAAPEVRLEGSPDAEPSWDESRVEVGEPEERGTGPSAAPESEWIPASLADAAPPPAAEARSEADAPEAWDPSGERAPQVAEALPVHGEPFAAADQGDALPVTDEPLAGSLSSDPPIVAAPEPERSDLLDEPHAPDEAPESAWASANDGVTNAEWPAWEIPAEEAGPSDRALDALSDGGPDEPAPPEEAPPALGEVADLETESAPASRSDHAAYDAAPPAVGDGELAMGEVEAMGGDDADPADWLLRLEPDVPPASPDDAASRVPPGEDPPPAFDFIDVDAEGERSAIPASVPAAPGADEPAPFSPDAALEAGPGEGVVIASLPGMSQGIAAALRREASAPTCLAARALPPELDPWGELELRPVDGFVSPASTVERLSDPPGHEVAGIDEVVDSPEGRLYLQTRDLAPGAAAIRCSVLRGAARVASFDRPYRDLLGPDGRALAPDVVARRVAGMHGEATRQLAEGGLAALLRWSALPAGGPR